MGLTIKKQNVIFICIHNSARSQMAEAYLKKYGGNRFTVFSAGLEPGELNPLVVEAMKRDKIDISDNKSTSIDWYRDGHIPFSYVITVCDETAAEQCPLFPGQGKKLHWSFKDPSVLKGNYQEKLTATIKIRDNIRARIINWLKSYPDRQGLMK